MARVRWVEGNLVGYGSGGWYREVLDVDVGADVITVWWGVETNVSLNDSTNSGGTLVNGGLSAWNNIHFSHGSGGGVTWLRGEAFGVAKGDTISFGGYVSGLADFSGGGGESSVDASWTNPPAPPNQMAPPIVNNISSTTHQAHFSAPGTNGAGITAFHYEYHYAEGGLYTAGDAYSTPIYASGFAPNRTYAVRLSAASGVGDGPWSAFTFFTQAIAVPLAPSQPTVTRTSDTSHSLSWTRADQTQGPYSSEEVLRRVQTSGVWSAYSVLASLSAGATSFVDTTTVANRVYQYQIRASNAAGNATSASSNLVFTTPGVPASQVAAKDAASNILVTWAAPSTAGSPSELKYEVSESTDGGTVWTVKTTTAVGVLTYTHTTPNPALPHLYRIRAIVNTTGVIGTGLASGYAVTNTVQLLTPPNAPTNLANTPAGTADRAQPIVLTWSHNAVDSTPQTKYTLQHRPVGGSWTTVGPITSSVSSYTLPANTYTTGTAFEWQVLTYGLHATSGPYSAVATVQVTSIPGVSISTPTSGGVVGGTVLTVTWAFSDPDGDPQSSWEAILIAASGQTLESRSGANTDVSTTFVYRLEEAAYSVRVRVRDSRGLWSTPDTNAFTVTYPLPPTPIITNTIWDWKRGTVEVNILLPAPADLEVPPIYLEVWRSINDGPMQRLITNLPPLTLSYLDFTPTVEGKNAYMIQAISDLPSGSQSDHADPNAIVITPEADDGRPGVWLSGGTDFTKVGRLAAEVQIDAGRIRERVLQRYAGRPLPVEHSGEHIDETWQVVGSLNTRWSKDVDLPAAPEDWLALGALPGPFLLRMPALFGAEPIYTYVSVDGPTVSRQVGGNVQQVSFTATRTEY